MLDGIIGRRELFSEIQVTINHRPYLEKELLPADRNIKDIILAVFISLEITKYELSGSKKVPGLEIAFSISVVSINVLPKFALVRESINVIRLSVGVNRQV